MILLFCWNNVGRAQTPASWESVETWIETDGSVDDGLRLDDPTASSTQTVAIPFVRGAVGPGAELGGNLFHSFGRFDLGAGDEAIFSAVDEAGIPIAFDHVISRVTSGQASFVNGRIASDIAGAQFWFLNPAGVFFGPEGSLDLPGSFHVTGAEWIELIDESRFGFFRESALPVTQLSSASPTAFGFLGDASGRLSVEGILEVERGATLSLIGGEIRLDGSLGGGAVSAPDGDVYLVSVASVEPGGATVSGGPFTGGAPILAGVSSRGDIVVEHGAIVSSSGISPILEPAPLVASVPFPPTSDPPPDSIILTIEVSGDQRQVWYLPPEEVERARTIASQLRDELDTTGGGNIFVRADDLTIVDSDIRSVVPGSPIDGSEIQIDLTGDLLATKANAANNVGVLARTGDTAVITVRVALSSFLGSGCEVALGSACAPIGDSFFLVSIPGLDVDATDGNGAGSDVSIRAANVRLQNGAVISTTSSSNGRGGRILVEATGTVRATGLDPTDPLGERRSAFFSNSQAGGDAGSISIEADRLELTEGGAVIAQTTGNGNAGSIDVDVNELVITDVSQIDSSTSGTSLGDDPPAGASTTGEGGDITVHARRSIRLSGREGPRDFARISTFSQALSSGGAGSISVATPELSIEDGAGLAVTVEGEGAGGDILVDAGTLILERDAVISASSQSTLAAGIIDLSTTGSMQLRSGSAVTASTLAGAGGDIAINSGGVLLLGEGTRVEADATVPGGSGGAVSISAPLTILAASAEVSADAPGGPQFQGTVEIRSPIVNLEDQVTPAAVAFLDASSELLAACSARRTGERAGSFTASRFPGLPVSPTGPLLAYDPILAPVQLASAQAPPPAVSTGPVVASAARSTPPEIQLASLATSVGTLRGGHAIQAETTFSALADASEGTLRADALRGAAQAKQLRGAYTESLPLLEEVLEDARAAGDAVREAAALGQLGNAYVALRENTRAEAHLTEAVAAARRADDRALLAVTLNNLGNLHAIENDWSEAQRAYAESAAEANDAGDPLRAAQALANAARAALEQDDGRAAASLLGEAQTVALDLDVRVEAITLRVHLAESYARLSTRSAALRGDGLRLAHRTLLEAVSEAGAVGDPRLQSLVYGTLGALYAQEGGRSEEALYLSHRALAYAEESQAAELLVRWHAQTGRIHAAAQEIDSAVAAYRRAADILEQTRPEARARYGGAEGSFEQAVAPVYQTLVGLLLERSSGLEGEDAQRTLRSARSTVERFKAAELRDYFQDECVAALEAQARPVESLSETAAVIYPIVLPDRLELLVSQPSGFTRRAVPVTANELGETVKEFRRSLVDIATNRHRRTGRKLYSWLLAPYVETLAAQGVDTLVVVPDGALRSIPWGALYDGKQFAIERFAVAVTPSLELIAPKPLDPADSRLLLAGVSEAVAGQKPLPSVLDELNTVHALYGGELLLDGQFRSDRFEEELRERPPGVVHIASHAQFTGDPRTSWILTHDEKITMDDLSQLVDRSRFGEEPLELLMLSACETAAGDERAALGLAGVAVRAGARSAVGSLWSVNDAASSKLIVRFYEEMGRPGVSKAEAMARAQRSLLTEYPLNHPFYWAGFLVINNWL